MVRHASDYSPSCAWAIRLARAVARPEFGAALEAVKARALVVFDGCRTAEEVTAAARRAGGFTRIVESAIAATAPGEEEDLGVWGRGNILLEAIRCQVPDLRFWLQKSLQGRVLGVERA